MSATPNSQRLASLDVLRGFAVLGIIFANIAAFGGPWIAEQMSGLGRTLSGADAAVDALITAFVAGKFRSTLVIVFGAGMYLQFAKRKRQGYGWPGGYVRRTLALGFIGLLHGVLLWYGDILLTYSITALIWMWLLMAEDKAQQMIMWVFAGLITMGTLLMSTVVALLPLLGDDPFKEMAPQLAAERVKEVAVFSNGSYLDQVLFRLEFLVTDGLMMILFVFALVPLLIAGAQMAKQGLLTWPSSNPRMAKRLQAWCLAVGLAGNLPALLFLTTGVPMWLRMAIEILFGPVLAVGVVLTIARYLENRSLGVVTGTVAKVGRMALSCYLLQSVIGTVIFYSWGFDLFNKLSYLEMVGVAVGIIAADIAFAIAWLKFSPVGPAEWLHRKLSGDLRPARQQVAFDV